MAVGLCLPPKVVDGFKQALVKGKLDPEKLATMTSEARHKALADIVGEGNAKFVNGQFESKLLLKNQQLGFVRWAEKLTGIAPEAKRDIISRIQKMDTFLNPAEEKMFLKDLASTRLGIDVSVNEAKKIALMSSKLQELEAKRRPDGTFPSESDRMAYGRAKTDLGGYLGELKLNANKVGIKDLPKESLLHPMTAASKVAGFAKSVKAAFDDSALLRQGWKTALSHPGIWGRNVRKNVMDLYNQGIKGKDVMREATADVISRPNAKYYEKMGIHPHVEEEFGDPALIMKIPGIGRIYKTTEVAFNAFMLRNRADLADYYLELAKKADLNLNDAKELKPIGKMIGGLTGRGDLGRFEGSAANATNNIFFSPRFVKSQVDTIGHVITGAGGSNFVRKEAAKNLVKITGMTAALFATANAIQPGSVELDPRSSKFGKIKVGDTTFDMTGGFSSIAVLAARLYSHQYKSNKSIVSSLGDNPGQVSGGKLIEQFVSGKLSPAAQRVWVNVITKEEFNGAKPTLGSNASNLLMPLPVSTYTEAKQDPHGANAIATEVADALGMSANTTNPAQQVKQLSKTEQGLQDKIGKQKYQQFTQTVDNKLSQFTNSSYYKNLPNDQKQSEYTYKEGVIKKNLYKQYGYTAPKTKTDKAQHRATTDASPN